MKTTKILLVLWISASIAAVAAACSSSSNGPVGPTSGPSAPAPTSPPRGSPTSGQRTSGMTIGCGPNLACTGILGVCCVGTAAGDAGNPGTARGDAAPLSDAAAEAANEAGSGGPSDSGADGDASGATDAATSSEAGVVGHDSGSGSSMMSGDAGGFTYHCAANAAACPAGTMSLGCSGINSCPSGQSCCGDYGDGGPFQAACSPPPCHTGINLCLTTGDCRTNQVCIPAADQGGVFGICVMSDAGVADGGGAVDSGKAVSDGSGGPSEAGGGG
jgi:hypothetical protein